MRVKLRTYFIIFSTFPILFFYQNCAEDQSTPDASIEYREASEIEYAAGEVDVRQNQTDLDEILNLTKASWDQDMADFSDDEMVNNVLHILDDLYVSFRDSDPQFAGPLLGLMKRLEDDRRLQEKLVDIARSDAQFVAN